MLPNISLSLSLLRRLFQFEPSRKYDENLNITEVILIRIIHEKNVLGTANESCNLKVKIK